jgi:hypothetical protein
MQIHKELLYFTDSDGQKIFTIELKSGEKKELSLPDNQPFFPIQNFTFLSSDRLFLHGGENNLSVLNLKSGAQKIVDGGIDSANKLHFEIGGFSNWGKFLMVNDRVAGAARIFSRNGNFLGTLPVHSESILAAGPYELLALHEEENETVVMHISPARKTVFANLPKQKDAEFSSLKFVGRSENGNIYISETSGPRHGQAQVYLVTLSPLGQLLSRKQAEVSALEFQEFRFFFILSGNQVFQIRLDEKSMEYSLIPFNS